MWSSDMMNDPVAELQPGSLPTSLEHLFLLHAKLPTISAGTLPPAMLKVYVRVGVR